MFKLAQYCFVLFVLLAENSFAQEDYENVEGFYNLSEFERASGLYLLKNKSFFYYDSFGNVDLKVIGTYKIENAKTIQLFPNKKLSSEFYVYAASTKNSDTIKITLKKPFSREVTEVALQTPIEKKQFPKFSPSKKEVSITIDRTKTLKLVMNGQTIQNLTIPKSINILKIYHNYYGKFIKRLSLQTFEINGESISDSSSFEDKEIKKVEMSTDKLETLKLFIENMKKKSTLFRLDLLNTIAYSLPANRYNIKSQLKLLPSIVICLINYFNDTKNTSIG